MKNLWCKLKTFIYVQNMFVKSLLTISNAFLQNKIFSRRVQ